jgi:hypothetical protein
LDGGDAIIAYPCILLTSAKWDPTPPSLQGSLSIFTTVLGIDLWFNHFHALFCYLLNAHHPSGTVRSNVPLKISTPNKRISFHPMIALKALPHCPQRSESLRCSFAIPMSYRELSDAPYFQDQCSRGRISCVSAGHCHASEDQSHIYAGQCPEKHHAQSLQSPRTLTSDLKTLCDRDNISLKLGTRTTKSNVPPPTGTISSDSTLLAMFQLHFV